MEIQPTTPSPPTGIPAPEAPVRDEAPPPEPPTEPAPEPAPTDADSATRVDVTA